MWKANQATIKKRKFDIKKCKNRRNIKRQRQVKNTQNKEKFFF